MLASLASDITTRSRDWLQARFRLDIGAGIECHSDGVQKCKRCRSYHFHLVTTTTTASTSSPSAGALWTTFPVLLLVTLFPWPDDVPWRASSKSELLARLSFSTRDQVVLRPGFDPSLSDQWTYGLFSTEQSLTYNLREGCPFRPGATWHWRLHVALLTGTDASTSSGSSRARHSSPWRVMSWSSSSFLLLLRVLLFW